jgi:glycosyltransferase involved in cell wall biosynthesis
MTVIAMRRRARRFRTLFVIRPSDRSILGSDLARRTAVLPGISATAVPLPATGARSRRVLFVGAAGWGPNREAIDWMLAQEIPRMLHASGYELRLVGRGTDAIPEVPGLSCGGFVEDLGAEYRDAQIVVCPIYSGTGANIKLAEAVQLGCAVVASPYAAAGFEGILLPGTHIEVFADPSRFAQTLTQLLAAPARLEELRTHAREVSANLLNQDRFSAIIAEGVAAALGR